MRSALDAIDEHRRIVFRVPRQMQVDFRVDVAGHMVFLPRRLRAGRISPLKRAGLVGGEDSVILAGKPVPKGLAYQPGFAGKAP